MPSQPEKEFHDPALKQAVCRCWASECASTMLRKRVARLLEEGSDKPVASVSSPFRINRFAWMVWPTALAALLLISVGLFNHFHTPPIQTAIALPADLENDLIRTHDHCCGQADHQHLPVPRNNDSAIAHCLHNKLNQPVIMFHPADSAWVFRGASVCPVGTNQSGHLVFVNGGGALSIFSLPKKSTLPEAKEGSEYADTVNQHRIVGFIRDGALFCMVSSGPENALSIDEMKKMESQMQPTVAVIPAPPGDKIMLTELLQPVR